MSGWRERLAGGRDHQLKVGPLPRHPADEIKSGQYAGKVGIGDHDRDLGMLAEHLVGGRGVEGVESFEARFAQYVGRDQADKRLIFHD